MEPVEGTAELSEALGSPAEAHRLKRKESDRPPQQPESHPIPVTSADAVWPEPRSPELSLEVLAGNSPGHAPDSQSADEPLSGGQRPLTDTGVMVEELTLKNYKSPDMYTGGCSSSGEGSSVRKGMWHSLTRMAGRPREALPSESLPMANRPEVGNLFLPQFGLQRPHPLPNKVSEHLHGSDSRAVSSNAATGPPGGIYTKILSASGFPQIMVKNNLKGKGVAYRHERPRNMPGSANRSQSNVRSGGNAPITSDSSHRPDAKSDGKSLFGGGSGVVSDIHRDGITLREQFKQRHHKFSRSEKLHIFKQILELVDLSHSQGLALQHLRPSNFQILPTNQVKYMGSFVRNSQMERLTGSADVEYLEHHSKRKRYLKQVKEAQLSPKHPKLGEHSQLGVQRNRYPARIDSKGSIVEEIDAGGFKTGKSESDYRKQLKLAESFHPFNMPLSSTTSSFGCRLSESEFMKMEEGWYASPEELNEGVCSFSSNIYNLGVLLFELFCYSETWEVHSGVMSDLQQRILPPNFLSESPKEASFCLWLLHPEPSSRPKSRVVLNCDLIRDGRDLSSVDLLPTSLAEEHAEADLLLHFLCTSKEQKEQQAAKLVTELGCLQADVEEIERRHSSRTGFLSNPRNLAMNFNGTSDMCSQKRPLHVETMSWLSTPITNEEGLMRNIDQLENAYFSMRFKLQPSETDAGARSDRDVLRIRDRCSQVQNNTDVRNESTDRVGAFFEGLCKYARYSRFEVRGSLRNGDVLNSANVVCSLSFDRDEEYFAAAGVSKKIKIFEFGALLNSSIDIHYPMIEMSSTSRLSCVCWNSYIKNYLASTDYNGVVQLWDASTGQGFTRYAGHQKRAWSVVFSQTDPVKLASGSDDCSVKLWSINERNCIDTIRSTANVCCVEFSDSSHLLAFGTADYKTYCYDLRNTRIPWCTLSGHGKAVSHVKFVNSETIVSASTDNTLKLWDLNKTNTDGLSTGACSLTFGGHTNEKNFVGLSVSDGYIACGSETNEVFAYYKSLPMPITAHKFGSIDPITGQETGNGNGQFVSSVCWRARSNMVIAANSSGSMKLLQLV